MNDNLECSCVTVHLSTVQLTQEITANYCAVTKGMRLCQKQGHAPCSDGLLDGAQLLYHQKDQALMFV